MAVWDLHYLINSVDEYPEKVIVHKKGLREVGRRYFPESDENGFDLRRAVDGLEGQLSALQEECEALRSENEILRETFGNAWQCRRYSDER